MSDVNTAVESAQLTQPESSTGELNSTGASSSSSEISVDEALDKAFDEGINEAEEKPKSNVDTNKAEADDKDADKFKSSHETRKQELNQEIRDLVAKRNHYKEEIARYEEMQLPTVEELTNYIMSQDEDISEENARTEARMRLNEASIQRQNQIETIAETRQEIDLAVAEASRDFPEIFDSKHAKFNRDLASGIMEMYEEMAGVQRGSDGEIVQARIKLAPFLQSIGMIYRLGQNAGKEMAEKATTNQRRQQIRQATNLYPSSKSSSNSGEMTEDEFVDSCLTD